MINYKCDFCGKDIASGYEISCKPFTTDEYMNVADLLVECGTWHMCCSCMSDLGKITQVIKEKFEKEKMLRKMYCVYP